MSRSSLTEPSASTKSAASTESAGAKPPRGEKAFVVGFILVGLLGPIVLGECYPFSIAPMFCQQPTCYCDYVVTDPEGNSLDLRRFQLQRVYDGNPEGMGVGIKPPPTFDRFGVVPTEQELIDHLQGLTDAWQGLPYVDVKVEVVGDVDGVTVGPIAERSYEVRVSAPGDSP